MGATYIVETEGLDEVVSAINRLGLRPADTLAWRKDMGEQFVLNVADRFATGTAPDGSKWPESGRVREGGGQTLLDHGRLRDSVHYTPLAGDLEISSNDIRADVHDKGKTILPKKGQFLVFAGAGGKLVFTRAVHMPKRTFMPEFNEGDSDSQYIESSFSEFVERLWDKGELMGSVSSSAGNSPSAASSSPARPSHAPASSHTPRRSTPKQSAPGGETWKSFTAAHMSECMRSEGSHGAAMKRLGTEWQSRKKK